MITDCEKTFSRMKYIKPCKPYKGNTLAYSAKKSKTSLRPLLVNASENRKQNLSHSPLV